MDNHSNAGGGGASFRLTPPMCVMALMKVYSHFLLFPHVLVLPARFQFKVSPRLTPTNTHTDIPLRKYGVDQKVVAQFRQVSRPTKPFMKDHYGMWCPTTLGNSEMELMA